MNVVLIIPTGIGASIGGHAGDANPVARLLGACCDILIVHPNVVNASDINEMPVNSLYVEGSTLDRFLKGDIRLEPVRNNKILLAVNKPVKPETINSVNAARYTLGADIEIIELEDPLRLIAAISSEGIATGTVMGRHSLIKQIQKYDFDVLAIQSVIEIDKVIAENYLKNGGVNPWGGVEAKLSRLVSQDLDKPVAHAPLDSGLFKNFNEVVDPRMAAEIVSVSYLHCVLKGLHTAPRILRNDLIGWPVGMGVEDVDVLVSPYGCIGIPHEACFKREIPVIAVKENQTCLSQIDFYGRIIYVENYWEAAGYIIAMKAGIDPKIVRKN